MYREKKIKIREVMILRRISPYLVYTSLGMIECPQGDAPNAGKIIISEGRMLSPKSTEPKVKVSGKMTPKEGVIPEEEEIEPIEEVNSSWYKENAANSNSTTIVDEHGSAYFDRWSLYENQFYFTDGSNFVSYNAGMLGLDLEYFQSGSLSTAPGAWINTLDIRSFYPYGVLMERGILDANLKVANTITKREFDNDQEDTYDDLDHVVDWNNNYVVGIGDQTVERENVLLLKYGPVTRPGEWRTRTWWQLVQYDPWQLSFEYVGGLLFNVDILPEYRPDGDYHYAGESARKLGSFGFWVERSYRKWYGPTTIPGGEIYGTKVTVKGTLKCIDRATKEVVGSYYPGFEVVYYSEDNYSHVSVDQWNQPIWTFSRGPYAKFTFNVPMLTDSNDIVIFQYEEYQEYCPDKNNPYIAYVQSMSAIIRFYLTDEELSNWENFTPEGLSGRTTWNDGDGFDPPKKDQFIFISSSNKSSGVPQFLCAPWIYGNKLFIHTLDTPYISRESKTYSSGKQAITYTYPTVIKAYTIKGESPVNVEIGNKSYRGSEWAAPDDWEFYVFGPDYDYGGVIKDPRLFVGDKNFLLDQTSEVEIE